MLSSAEVVEYNISEEEREMQASELEEKINIFLMRKDAKFPGLALSGRHESRTVKYAESRTPLFPKHFFSR